MIEPGAVVHANGNNAVGGLGGAIQTTRGFMGWSSAVGGAGGSRTTAGTTVGGAEVAVAATPLAGPAGPGVRLGPASQR